MCCLGVGERRAGWFSVPTTRESGQGRGRALTDASLLGEHDVASVVSTELIDPLGVRHDDGSVAGLVERDELAPCESREDAPTCQSLFQDVLSSPRLPAALPSPGLSQNRGVCPELGQDSQWSSWLSCGPVGRLCGWVAGPVCVASNTSSSCMASSSDSLPKRSQLSFMEEMSCWRASVWVVGGGGPGNTPSDADSRGALGAEGRG